MPIRIHDPAGSAIAALLIVLGIVLVRQTGSMTAMGSVFPITISVALIVFSAILILRNLIIGIRGGRAGAASDPEVAEGSGGSNLRRAAFLAAMVAWVLLIPVLGFFSASVIGYFAIMAAALHDRMPARNLVLMVALGLAVLVGFYLLMAEVLLIPMPRGLFF